MATRGKKKATKDPSYRNLKADYYPVQRVMNLASTATEVDYYALDVGRCLSVQNKRLYRQGKTYSCKIDLDPGSGPVRYNVYALVDTWYIQKAWQLARAAYMKSTADEREMMNSQKLARWEDFRVAPGLSGSGAGIIVPAPFSNGLAPSADTDGEFELSRVTLSDGTTQRTFTWSATAGAGQYAILPEYDASGATDNAPTIVSGANAYEGIDGNVHESQMDDLADKGNAPPYNGSTMSTRIWVRVGVLDAGSAHGKLSTGYFNAPCGLIAVQPSTPSTAITNQLSLTVAAGDYKGVKAHNMGV